MNWSEAELIIVFANFNNLVFRTNKATVSPLNEHDNKFLHEELLTSNVELLERNETLNDSGLHFLSLQF
ncbi:hypothetical protein BLOT_013113 [Blomia tropicalis]|nr:hypothetical protein BLOT_013113 [Blomia tropicalis]